MTFVFSPHIFLFLSSSQQDVESSLQASVVDSMLIPETKFSEAMTGCCVCVCDMHNDT